jgi:tetratricopeptide (TPR) repeat protein
MRRDQRRPRRELTRAAVAIVLLALAFPCAAGPASLPSLKNWHEVRVPGFVIISDAGEGPTRRFAARLFGWRNTFARIWPQADPGTKPVIVLALKSISTLCALLPTSCGASQAKPAGLFLPGLDRDYLALALDAEGLGSSDVLGHEFAHLLLDRHAEPLPLWLDEGIAELVATGDMGRGRVGAPNPTYLALLQQHSLLPLTSFLSMARTSPGYRDESLAPLFYAQAWALVHYLELADGGEQVWRLTAFVGLLSRGVPDGDAAAQAFGDSGGLTRALTDYVRSGRLQDTSLSLPLLVPREDPPARRLTAAETALTLGDFLGHTDRYSDAVELLNRAARDGFAAASLERMSLIDLRRGDFDRAHRDADDALALESSLVAAYYVRGAAVIAQPARQEQIDQAERDLREAMRLDDKFAPAYSVLGTLLAFRPAGTSEALGLIRRAVSLEPSVVGHRVALAEALLLAGQSEEAEHIAIRIIARARSLHEREIGQQLLQLTATAVASHRHQ